MVAGSSEIIELTGELSHQTFGWQEKKWIIESPKINSPFWIKPKLTCLHMAMQVLSGLIWLQHKCYNYFCFMNALHVTVVHLIIKNRKKRPFFLDTAYLKTDWFFLSFGFCTSIVSGFTWKHLQKCLNEEVFLCHASVHWSIGRNYQHVQLNEGYL